MAEAKRLLKNGRDIIDVTFTLRFNSQSHLRIFLKSMPEWHRNNIDRIDNEIIKLIAERGNYVVQASAF